MSRLRPARRAGRDVRKPNDRLAVFMRGATLGAFVGAAIAGSTGWQRLRRRVVARRAAAAAGHAKSNPPDRPLGAGVDPSDR